MITLKIKYIAENKSDNQVIADYQKQYNNLLHLFYNRLKDDVSETACKHLQFNNLDLMKSWFRQSCVKDASFLLKKNEGTVLFGGKHLFEQRFRHNISKEEFKEKRLIPLCSIGDKNYRGNRFFRLSEDYYSITFSPVFKNKIKLKLIGVGNRIKVLQKVYLHQQLKDTPITYKLDKKYIYISFDESILQDEIVKPISNRIFSIDMNPNYIGWSVVDWKSSDEFKVVNSGVVSLKNINDVEYKFKKLKLPSTSKERKYLSNKRNYETLEVSKFLIDIAKHYQCECFAIEDLSIKSKDNH